VLPELFGIDDQTGQKIAQNSIKVKEHLELHNALIDNELQKVSFSKNGLHYIQIQGLHSYPQSHLMLYRILHKWGFNYDECKQISQTSTVGAIVESGTHSVVRDRDYWIVSPLTSQPRHVEITTPGDYTFGSYHISVLEAPLGQVIERNKSTIYLNPNLTGKLTVRSWQEGDRIQPFGMSGTKLVSDVLSDNKIPNTHKQGIPIVVDQKNQIIWVAGLCFSERFRQVLRDGRLVSHAWRLTLHNT
jgi:tRNA(Ile)-lysidine synthase